MIMESIFLQTTGTAVIAAIFVAIIISGIFFVIQKKSIKNQIATLHDPKIKYDVERIQKDLETNTLEKQERIEKINSCILREFYQH